MNRYYTVIMTHKTYSLDVKTEVHTFETYDFFKSYAVDKAGDPDVSKLRLLKTELGRVPKVTELKLSFKDNLVVFKEVTD